MRVIIVKWLNEPVKVVFQSFCLLLVGAFLDTTPKPPNNNQGGWLGGVLVQFDPKSNKSTNSKLFIS